MYVTRKKIVFLIKIVLVVFFSMLRCTPFTPSAHLLPPQSFIWFFLFRPFNIQWSRFYFHCIIFFILFQWIPTIPSALSDLSRKFSHPSIRFRLSKWIQPPENRSEIATVCVFVAKQVISLFCGRAVCTCSNVLSSFHYTIWLVFYRRTRRIYW